jgi:hypothetical protein
MRTTTNGVLIATVIFGLNSGALADAIVMSHMPAGAQGAIATECLPWQAPIGHRQSGLADVGNLPPRPSDLELQALDKAVDRKLMICRGC